MVAKVAFEQFIDVVARVATDFGEVDEVVGCSGKVGGDAAEAKRRRRCVEVECGFLRGAEKTGFKRIDLLEVDQFGR